MEMYRDWSDDVLDEHRRAILAEQERRAKLAELPDQLADMARDAVAAGCDPVTIRNRVDEALEPGEKL